MGGGRGGGGGLGWWGVKVDVNKELKFVKIQEKKIFWVGVGGGVGLVGWVRVDVNEELNFL